tara:strand:- start:1508 stop:1750 length:243 start_codon:yes stop_codon:yes gene_type:complete
MVEIEEVDLQKEIDELKSKCIGYEDKLNSVIAMTNDLIKNVNNANQFVAALHNGLADAGIIKKPEEVAADEPEPEPEPQN